MKTSARNAFRCTVSEVRRAPVNVEVSTRNRILGTVIERTDGGVNSEVVLDIGDGKTLTSVVTKDAADALELRVGDAACAFFMASQVILATD